MVKFSNDLLIPNKKVGGKMLGWFKDETELKKLKDFTSIAKYLQNYCKISFKSSAKWKYALLPSYKYQNFLEIDFAYAGKLCLKKVEKHNQNWCDFVVVGMVRQGVFE